MNSVDLVPVGIFPSVADAQIAQGILDALEIQSLIRSDNAGSMYPGLDSAELLVRLEDAEAAKTALRESGTP